MECIDISAEWREVGKTQSLKFVVGYLHRLGEMHAGAANPCSGHERHLCESGLVVMKEVNDVVDYFLNQVHLVGEEELCDIGLLDHSGSHGLHDR